MYFNKKASQFVMLFYYLIYKLLIKIKYRLVFFMFNYSVEILLSAVCKFEMNSIIAARL